MTQFKVGDRVRYIHDGVEGTVQGEMEGTLIDVLWDDEGLVEMYTGDLELVEGPPNRTYYASLNDIAKAAEEVGRIRMGASGEYDERELLRTPFENNVHRHLNKIADILISKNKQYANSALDPIRVFSKADRMEQLRVRADDKLSRIRNGDTSEDAVTDLCGYLILMKIAEESS